jgi:hypothetical protein
LSDLLSAASLLLAVLGVLYGLWYPEIMEALKEEVPHFSQDRRRPYQKISFILYGRALPLAIAASGVSLIFIPDAYRIILFSIQNYKLRGLDALNDFHAVSTAYCFVIAMSTAIAAHLIFFSVKLGLLRKRLSSDVDKAR